MDASEKCALVVDDDPGTLTLMRHFFRALGYGVICVASGPEALEVLQQGSDRIALVLLDIAMPGMNGIEVAQAIRATRQLADLPIIAVTARADAGVQAEADSAGINLVITKPFDPGTLRGVVSKILSG
jgi:CheY-like chemotaxis protein